MDSCGSASPHLQQRLKLAAQEPGGDHLPFLSPRRRGTPARPRCVTSKPRSTRHPPCDVDRRGPRPRRSHHILGLAAGLPRRGSGDILKLKCHAANNDVGDMRHLEVHAGAPVRYVFNPRYAATLRVETFSDLNGFLTGKPGAARRLRVAARDAPGAGGASMTAPRPHSCRSACVR